RWDPEKRCIGCDYRSGDETVYPGSYISKDRGAAGNLQLISCPGISQETRSCLIGPKGFMVKIFGLLFPEARKCRVISLKMSNKLY
ncbi:MAG: hypothetical protein LUQ49_00400, partial [Methanomicrobiales archaeon]|nr:hypothetical protein [Methanomicrobiales archaeon]